MRGPRYRVGSCSATAGENVRQAQKNKSGRRRELTSRMRCRTRFRRGRRWGTSCHASEYNVSSRTNRKGYTRLDSHLPRAVDQFKHRSTDPANAAHRRQARLLFVLLRSRGILLLRFVSFDRVGDAGLFVVELLARHNHVVVVVGRRVRGGTVIGSRGLGRQSGCLTSAFLFK